MSVGRLAPPQLTSQVHKLRDRSLLEGAMATSALVAMADRRIRIEEDIAVSEVVETVELLQIYDPNLAVSMHAGFVEALRTDFDAGKRRALEVISRCASDLEAAELCVQVGITVAKADRELADSEVEMIDEICRSLDIDGLDTRSLVGPLDRPRTTRPN